jgi:alpha-glucosidase
MNQLRASASLFFASLLLAAAASAQVLARPGWAGSGVTVETWWQRAVFYRLNPATFQDSNGDGRGDLGGVAQRMDYLQSLGVDAIILAPAASSPQLSPADMSDGFDDLVRQASLHHVRVLVVLDVSYMQPRSGGNGLLAAARSWLTQGAAGFFLESSLLADPQFSADLLHQLRSLAATFPGERILLSAAPPAQNTALEPALRREVQLIASPPLGGEAPLTAAMLRRQVSESIGAAPVISTAHSRTAPSGLPLLVAARNLPAPDDRQRGLLQRDLAMLLLASRSAVLLDYGEELGLDTAAGNAPLMQWTPSNRTVAPKPIPEMPTSFDAIEYKAYTPYIAPLPRSLNPPPPPLPAAFVSEKPDPLTLPGFSSVSPDDSLSGLAAPNGITANVVTEDAQPYSLLNLYRHLMELHHQNPSLHDGAQLFLDHDADDVLVWLRRPAPGARISTTVLAVCNLTDHNLHLALNSELRTLRAPYGGLRTLASGSPVPFQDSEDIVLPAGGAFLGEFSR